MSPKSQRSLSRATDSSVKQVFVAHHWTYKDNTDITVEINNCCSSDIRGCYAAHPSLANREFLLLFWLHLGYTGNEAVLW